MKPLLALSVACLALPATAQSPATTDYSALLRDNGLVGARATLSAIAAPTPSDSFALGGVLFLSAIERALQTRWKAGLTDGLTTMADIPVLRLPIPENPAPAPFDPAMIAELFQSMSDDLAVAIATLAPIPDDSDLAVTINTADIWFDINANAARDAGESFTDVAGLMIDGGFGPGLPDITVRFDTADAAWLLAYAHLLSATAETILALSPTDAITRVLASRAAMETLSTFPPGDPFRAEAANIADLIAIVVATLEQRPDPMQAARVHRHLQDAIIGNRNFWRLVARETDNNAEWIPNKRQTSALPLDFPPDTGMRWLAVLSDAEAVLTGDLLIPHWTLGPDAGINLARLFEDPPTIDIVGMIQGGTLVPYMEQGRLVDSTSLRAFQQLVGGDAGLFMLVLN
jgi:hypothetical protein